VEAGREDSTEKNWHSGNGGVDGFFTIKERGAVMAKNNENRCPT
jgi:hypothetical protein